MDPLRIGIVGLGNISGIYFQNLARYRSTEVVAVADLDEEHAHRVAEARGIQQVFSPQALFVSPDVELVLNLTVPKAHFSVALAALEAGKHVYNEKPITVDKRDGQTLLEAGSRFGTLIGCAPDTFMGAGIQTARKLIDEGAIGEPVAANAFMLSRGHETWHPNPEFYYEAGGGPMLDMGPYYVTALVNLLGPVRRVCGSARASFVTRTISSQPKAGKVVNVETPTHIAGIMDFASGAIGQITTSFDVYGNALPNITIYGSEGTLVVPDPNNFGGELLIRSAKGSQFEAVPLSHVHTENSRGLGVLDMAYALRTGRPHRASGALAYHVLDIMDAIVTSSEEERYLHLTTGVDRPAALSVDEYADELAPP